MRHILTLILTFAAFLLLLAGCESDKTDSRLRSVADTVSDSPKAALDSLAVIDRNSLNEADRHYYDFLCIKAGDKDFRRQPNDSLILSVLNYYSSHKDENIYPEVLYYCGRVYSDLGDVPTALSYYKKSLDLIISSNRQQKLKAKILAQQGYLFSYIHLYTEAYTSLEEALNIVRSQTPTDSLGIYHLLFQLGESYMLANEFQKADSVTQLALSMKDCIPPSELGRSYNNMASLNRKLNNLKKALYYANLAIIHSPQHLNSTALANKAAILYNQKDYKSAYHTADSIIHGAQQHQKRVGYEIILAPELRQFVPEDSLNIYFDRFRSLLLNNYNENDVRLAIDQQTHYNYNYHEQNAIKYHRQRNSLNVIVVILSIMTILAVCLYFIRRKRHTKTLKDLKEALNTVVLLEKSEYLLTQRLKEANEKLNVDSGNTNQVNIKKTSNNDSKESCFILENPLRGNLRRKLEVLNDEYKNKGIKIPINSKILKSTVYKEIENNLTKGTIISEDSKIWEKLSALLDRVSPDFIENLKLLIGNDLRSFDMQTCMLIKCGFGTTQIAKLIGRESNTVSTRKKSLNSRIFGEPKSGKGIDGIIMLL